MSAAQRVYKHTLQAVVFSHDPHYWQHLLAAEAETQESRELKQVDYDISEGDCIGDVRYLGGVEVPGDQLAGELKRIGNDGGFFDDPFGEDDGDQPNSNPGGEVL